MKMILKFIRHQIIKLSPFHIITLVRSQLLTSLTLFTSLTLLTGQPIVKVEVSADTINPGELVEVTYTIENGEGRFEAPDLKALLVVSGPNTSSSFMFANGKKSSSQSYSYILKAAEEGKIIIPEAGFREGEYRLKIDPVEIIVLRHSNRPPVASPPDKTTKPIREKKKF